MKLKELLEVIPENYEIGLANFDKDNGIIVYGTKEDAIQKFAEKEKFVKEQVEGMNVIAIHPGATAYMPPSGVELYGDDSAEVHVKSKLLIEVSLEEPEDND